MEQFHATTILAVRRGTHVVLAGDGQVTLGSTVVKHGAMKLRKIYDDSVLAGFAGATADAFTLFERFEGKLKDYSGNVTRAAVELTKDWRTDRILRKLEAMLLIADSERTLLLSGTGDVLEPCDTGVIRAKDHGQSGNRTFGQPTTVIGILGRKPAYGVLVLKERRGWILNCIDQMGA